MYELPAIEVQALRSDLNQRAMELYETPARWEEAAKLHVAAARHLDANDAGQFFGYQRGGLLYFYVGDFADARKNLERAAEVADATGDLVTAANAWVDAAFAAIAEGYAGKKREFVRNARALADSDLMTAEERDAVVRRIDGAPAGAASARVAMAERFGSVLTLAARTAD
jgi:hypothetical protein